MMAQHEGRWSSGRVIVRRQHTAAKRTDTKCREIIAGDELRAKWPRCGAGALAPDAHARAACLNSRDLLELRSLRLQSLVERKREHSPAILGAALDTAMVTIADAIQPRRIGYRQRAEHDG